MIALLLPVRRPLRAQLRPILLYLSSNPNQRDRPIYTPFTPILHKRTRPFHHTSSTLKTANSYVKSKSTVNKERNPTYRSRHELDHQDLPQIRAIIIEKCMSTDSTIDVRRAMSFIEGCAIDITEGFQPSARSLRSLLAHPDIRLTAEDATTLALFILSVFRENGLAWWIIASASLMKNTAATLYAVAVGCQRREGNEKVKANAVELALPNMTQYIRSMDPEEPDRQALALYGMVMERQLNHKSALHYYEAAMKAGTDVQRPPLLQDMLAPLIKDPWYGVSIMKAALQDREGAIKALEYGAFEMDSPSAYWHIAMRFMDEYDTNTRRDYLLKCAQIGYPGAAGELGVYYVRQSQLRRAKLLSGVEKRPLYSRALRALLFKGQSVSKSDRVYRNVVRETLRMGIEWLRISAYSGPSVHVERSNIFLGLALRELALMDILSIQESKRYDASVANKHSQEGWKCMAKEEKNPEWSGIVKYMMENWHNSLPFRFDHEVLGKLLIGLTPSEVLTPDAVWHRGIGR